MSPIIPTVPTRVLKTQVAPKVKCYPPVGDDTVSGTLAIHGVPSLLTAIWDYINLGA